MMKSATPVKQNQGTEVGQQKIILQRKKLLPLITQNCTEENRFVENRFPKYFLILRYL